MKGFQVLNLIRALYGEVTSVNLHCSTFYSQLRKEVNNVRMVVSPLWRGLGNIHGFVLDRKSYQQG